MCYEVIWVPKKEYLLLERDRFFKKHSTYTLYSIRLHLYGVLISIERLNFISR